MSLNYLRQIHDADLLYPSISQHILRRRTSALGLPRPLGFAPRLPVDNDKRTYAGMSLLAQMMS